MQARFIHTGVLIDYTPSSAVTAGTPISQNGYVGIPTLDIAANALGALAVTGVFDIVKVSGVLSVGDIIGWDNDGDPVGGVAGSGAATKTLANADFVLGTVIAAAVEAGAVARTQLNQYPGSKILDTFPAIAAIADMAAQTQDDLTNGLSPTADTTLADITPPAEITDNSGGTDPGDDTIAVVTNSANAGSADLAPTTAAIAQLAAKANVTATAITAIEANQADVAAQLVKIKADVGASDTKIDAILAALRSAGIIAT